MSRAFLLALATLTASVGAVPAAAHENEPRWSSRSWVYSENNPHYRDYLTDQSEARRELRGDLRRAKSAQDRREAWGEYRREIADARKDFAKEMEEKGYAVNWDRRSVRVIE